MVDARAPSVRVYVHVCVSVCVSIALVERAAANMCGEPQNISNGPTESVCV